MLLTKLKEIAFPVTNNNSFTPTHLDNLAEFIFQKLLITNDTESFRFCEIEFYIWSSSHQDPFSHKAKEQKKFGHWYFHESGLDITFGNDKTYASFLIRGIRSEDSEKVDRHISGPLKVMKALCNTSGEIDKGGINLNVKLSDLYPRVDWINYQRIGFYPKKENLVKSNSNNPEIFHDKPYRYISCLTPDHKFPERLKALEHAYKPGENKEIIEKAFNYKPGFLKD